MKRLLTLILSLLLIVCLAGNAFATDDGAVLTVGATDAAYVVDNADLLTDSEEAELTRLAEEISQRQHCDVVILTENAIEGIVFWLDGAPVCKIKRTDFGLPWPIRSDIHQ